jgi:hypothetical protein
MEQAKEARHWERYRELYRKLNRGPGIARKALRDKK